jgi:hypothetical protein
MADINLLQRWLFLHAHAGIPQESEALTLMNKHTTAYAVLDNAVFVLEII